MLMLISPAKTLDYTTPTTTTHISQPQFIPQAEALVQVLKLKKLGIRIKSIREYLK